MRPLVAAIVLIGLGLTAAATVTAAEHNKDTVSDWLEERAEFVANETRRTVDRAVDALLAISVFLETTDTPSQATFGAFAGGLDPAFSLIGIAYLPVILDSELDSYLAEIRTEIPDFNITEISTQGELIPATRDREVYFPVQYFLPGSLLSQALATEESPLGLSVGVDGGSQAPWRPGIEAAVASDNPTVSGFIEIAFSDTFVGKSFIVAVPVHDASGTVIGLVAAPMIDVLLPTELELSIASDITWSIGSDAVKSDDKFSFVLPVEMPGASWDITVTATSAARRELAGTPWQIVAVAGIAITAAMALLGHLQMARKSSRRRLAEMDRLGSDKDRFIASISHEIRTPLTIVMGIANELRDRPEDFGFTETRDLMSLMVEQSDEVAAIVDDLLIAARADFDGVSVTATRMCLLEEAQHTLESSGLTARLVGDATPAITDAARVRQILRNLLTNADRYGGPEIEVWVESRGDRAVISVADNGPPIPNANRKSMFEAYTSTRSPDPSLASIGIGLGLFVSTQLATLLHGELTYHHDGRHSIFSLSLPGAPPAINGMPPADLLEREAVWSDRQLVNRAEETTL